MVHSPVTGQRVSRRRRGDEIAQQVSARVGKETHFTNFHTSTFTIDHRTTLAHDLAFMKLGAVTSELRHSGFFYRLRRSTSLDSSDQRSPQTV